MSETPCLEAGELSVSFQVHDPGPREVLRIMPNGRFFVHGREVETDAEVRNLFAQWVRGLGKNTSLIPAVPAPCRAGCPVREAARFVHDQPENQRIVGAAALCAALAAPCAPAGPEPTLDDPKVSAYWNARTCICGQDASRHRSAEPDCKGFDPDLAGPEPAFPHCEHCGSSAWFCTVCHARAANPSLLNQLAGSPPERGTAAKKDNG